MHPLLASTFASSSRRPAGSALLAGLACSLALASGASLASAQSVSFGGQTFVNQGLVGVGRVSASLRDSFGETHGSFSAFHLDPGSWSFNSGTGAYSGTLYTQPDRGYNVAGTTNYVPRYNQFNFTFTPAPSGSVSQNQVQLTLVSTTRYQESGGTPMTSLDPTPTGTGTRAGLGSTPLPQAFNGRLSLDAEGIVRRADGSLYVSDEYGPYVYRFSADGTLQSVLPVPAALLPQRSGATSFSSNNPGSGQPAPSPTNPVSGRQNNQGIEGLTITPDGTRLVALLQSATRQDLNTASTATTRGNTRMLVYDIATNPAAPTLVAEHVVQLPTYQPTTASGPGAAQVAAQSELVAINNTQFLLLARDGRGNGLDNPATATVDEGQSDYRRVLLLDTSGATNILGTGFDALGATISPNGVLDGSITAALSASFVDINDSVQLSKFGLRNGGTVTDGNNLSEKWEALAFAPVLDGAAGEYFLFVGNDNDFITTDGFQDGAAYNGGFDNDNMVLVYRVTLPTAQTPIPEPASAAALAGLLGLGLAATRRRRARA